MSNATPSAQAVGKALAEFPAPAPYRLVGDGNASLSQYQFDVAQAQAEDMIQPDSMANDLGGEPMAVAWIGWRLHPTNLVQTRPDRQPVTVTMPGTRIRRADCWRWR